MGVLQDRIVKDFKDSLKTRSKDYDSLVVIVGELQRCSTKILSDDEVTRVLKKLKKYEMENLNIRREETSDYLKILKSYLPEEISKEEIKEWILDNIDFSNIKNKFQIIGRVVKHFGNNIDGNIVKEIIENIKI